MERIQSAIEKARARRQGQPERPPAPRSSSTAPPPPVMDTAEALWAKIPDYVPNRKALERSRVVTFAGSPLSGPFDMMRTKILQQTRAQGWRRIAITSPTWGCGKTTLSANLAFSLARQPDLRIALIELDLHRPAFAPTLGLGEGNQQFSEVLAGRPDAEDHLLRYGTTLLIGPNHKPVRNAAELLQAETASAALAGFEERLGLNLTIFDMPPMRATDDMLAFAREVDCVLLVAAAEQTTVEEIDLCERELAQQTNLLGVVLNKCRYMNGAYGYSAYD